MELELSVILEEDFANNVLCFSFRLINLGEPIVKTPPNLQVISLLLVYCSLPSPLCPSDSLLLVIVGTFGCFLYRLFVSVFFCVCPFTRLALISSS